MKYDNIRDGIFKERPNRFIAKCLTDGGEQICHVKNTGRCRELLVPGTKVLLNYCPAANRKTEYDLISVYKGQTLINIDSNAPNAVFGEFLRGGGFGFTPTLVKPECTHGDSRFDYYFEVGGRNVFAEIKGVTLEDNGILRFPDAPTERGRKHMLGLAECIRQGYEAWAVFIIQMKGAVFFEPNRSTDPDFAEALEAAAAAGVNILAYDCITERDSLRMDSPVEIKL